MPICAVQLWRRTLISPWVHRVWLTLIAGTAGLKESIQKINGVDTLSAGAVPPNPLELSSSERFVALIEHLKTVYDRIVIDSPPTQAVSDALMSGNLADALIYVIKSDDTAIPLAVKVLANYCKAMRQ